MFLKPDFFEVLFSLLPPGDAYSKEDESFMQILGPLSLEFSRYFDWVQNVSRSIPDASCSELKPYWDKILGTTNLPSRLAERGLYENDTLVTNTKNHFLELAKHFGFSPVITEPKPFVVRLVDIPWFGKRDKRNTEDANSFVERILLLKHAHLWIEIFANQEAADAQDR